MPVFSGINISPSKYSGYLVPIRPYLGLSERPFKQKFVHGLLRFKNLVPYRFRALVSAFSRPDGVHYRLYYYFMRSRKMLKINYSVLHLPTEHSVK